MARGRGVEAEAGANALLPGALLSLAFFDLCPDGGKRFASELTHLHVKQRGHDRDKRDNEDIYQINKLLEGLRRK